MVGREAGPPACVEVAGLEGLTTAPPCAACCLLLVICCPLPPSPGSPLHSCALHRTAPNSYRTHDTLWRPLTTHHCLPAATTESLDSPRGALCCICNFQAPDDGADDGEEADTPAPRPQLTGVAAGCKATDFVVAAEAGCEMQCERRLARQPAGTYKRAAAYAGTAGKLCCGCNFAKAAAEPSPSPPAVSPEVLRATAASPPPAAVPSLPPPAVVLPAVVEAAAIEAATESAAAPEPAPEEGGCREGWHPLVGSAEECTWICKRRLQGKEEGTTIDPEAYPGAAGQGRVGRDGGACSVGGRHAWPAVSEWMGLGTWQGHQLHPSPVVAPLLRALCRHHWRAVLRLPVRPRGGEGGGQGAVRGRQEGGRGCGSQGSRAAGAVSLLLLWFACCMPHASCRVQAACSGMASMHTHMPLAVPAGSNEPLFPLSTHRSPALCLLRPRSP
jgi:hypothetical protein